MELWDDIRKFKAGESYKKNWQSFEPYYEHYYFHCNKMGKKYGTTQKISRPGHPMKLSKWEEKLWEKWLRGQLRHWQFQSSLAEMRETSQRSIISSALQRFVQWGSGYTEATSEKANIKSHLEFTMRNASILEWPSRIHGQIHLRNRSMTWQLLSTNALHLL